VKFKFFHKITVIKEKFLAIFHWLPGWIEHVQGRILAVGCASLL